jgi:hypothetical protein
MTIDELTNVIEAAGGRANALAYAEALLGKLNRIGATGRFEALLNQFCTAREAGDFRGRVLEVNFADLFVQKGRELIYGAQQGMSGDIDFQWNVSGREVFIEMKLLGQDRDTKTKASRQLEHFGVTALHVEDDLRDVVRLQRDIIQKATPRKFNPSPKSGALNIVAVDVSELQLGAVDIADCLLAAGGNAIVRQYYDPAFCRNGVVGVFEPISGSVTTEQAAWIADVHKIPSGSLHPRQYIHGAVFLFREPQETAALSYDLTAAIVWNPALVEPDVARAVAAELHSVIPVPRPEAPLV